MASADSNTGAEFRRAGWWALPHVVVLILALATMPPAPSSEGLDMHKASGQRATDEGPSQPMGEPLDPPVPADGSPFPHQWTGKRNIDRLLRGRWFALRNPRSASQTHSDLISLLRGGAPAISVINLWAPGCEPCKREFPEFRRLQTGWGREVRFVSVQLGKDDPGELLPLLPPPAFDLYDIGSGNGTVREQLAALGLVVKNPTIPLTMVLDCRNQLRWLRTQEITDMDGFAGVIKQFRDELGTSSCPAPEPAATASTEVAGPQCGNKRCEAGETSETCCGDCPCAGASRCEDRGGRPVCVMPVSGLQD